MAQIILCAGISWLPYMRPVGTYQLANVLRNEGYTVQVIDSFPYIAKKGYQTVIDLFEHFVQEDTLWIGFSTTWFKKMIGPGAVINPGHVYKDVKSIVTNTVLFSNDELSLIKEAVLKRSPKCKFVIGGGRAVMGHFNSDDLPYVSSGPYIDCYIEGYADTSVVKWTKYLEGKNPFIQLKKNLDGSFRVDDDHKASTFNYNNHKFTWDERDLVNHGEALPMEIARGCIFKCNFCAYPLNGRKKLDYLKDPAIILDQLEENYDRFGTTKYWFLDDTFNDSPEKLEILYNQVFSKLKFKLNFNAYMRLDLMNAHPHTIDLLQASGVGGFSLGIESLNYESNKSIGKGISRDKIVSTLQKIKDTCPDAYVDAQFIMGLPHDTEASIRSWVTEVLTPEFPLTQAKVHPLSLTSFKVVQNIWTSDFEKYPEKYGYTFPKSTNLAYWVNNVGFSLDDAHRIGREFKEKMYVGEKDAWIVYHGMRNMGVPEDQMNYMINLHRSDRVTFDTGYRTRFVDNYIERLKQLPS
jgi:radical SAM superfamily enzyme YgiQ (UPF0313 family)